jgi:hypothetical protein
VNGKWTKFAMVAVAVLISMMALSSVASAQGPQPGGMGGGGGTQNSLVAVAATVLGLDQTTLVSTLNSGKTIADVAKEKGVALDKIVDAFLAPRAENLKSAVTAGRLTQAQADTWLATMKTNVTAQLNAEFTPRGDGTGTGFVDANNDGVCDNCGTGRMGGMGGMGGRRNR